MSRVQIPKMNNDINETLILKDCNRLQDEEENNRCNINNISSMRSHVIIPNKVAFISLFCSSLLLSSIFCYLGMLQVTKAHENRIRELEENPKLARNLESTNMDILDHLNKTSFHIEGLVQNMREELKNAFTSVNGVKDNIGKLSRNVSVELQELSQSINDTIRNAVDSGSYSVMENHRDVIQKEFYSNIRGNLDTLQEKMNNIEDLVNKTALRARTMLTSNMDCADIYKISGHRKNGLYRIAPSGWKDEIQVYCDMETDGGGWTVFQKRGSFNLSADYFSKTWVEYKTGFGDLEKEFWLGNDIISALSNQREQELRLDLTHKNGSTAYAKFDDFRVEDESRQYRLHVEGYTGSQKDALSWHNGMKFTTKDRDNDNYSGHCGQLIEGGWWYNECIDSNLNGLNMEGHFETNWKEKFSYLGTDVLKRLHLIRWNTEFRPLAATEMKMRPVNFAKRCQ